MPLFIALAGVVGLLLLAAEAQGAGMPPHSGGISRPEEWTVEDFQSLAALSHQLGMNPADLLVVLWSESGGHPWAQFPKAPAYPQAAGLNQITSVAAATAGLSEAQRADMVHWTVAQQLPVVEHYFSHLGWPYSYPNAGIIYAMNFGANRVKARGTAPDTVLYDTSDGNAYTTNSAFDTEKKGYITIQDLSNHLQVVASRPDYQGALQALRYATGDGSLSPNFHSA